MTWRLAASAFLGLGFLACRVWVARSSIRRLWIACAGWAATRVVRWAERMCLMRRWWVLVRLSLELALRSTMLPWCGVALSHLPAPLPGSDQDRPCWFRGASMVRALEWWWQSTQSLCQTRDVVCVWYGRSARQENEWRETSVLSASGGFDLFSVLVYVSLCVLYTFDRKTV
jgi:hypothetical protein